MGEPDFAAGNYDTGYIGKHESVLLTAGSAEDRGDAMAIGAAIARATEDDRLAREAAQRAMGSGGGVPSMTPWRLGGLARLR